MDKERKSHPLTPIKVIHATTSLLFFIASLPACTPSPKPSPEAANSETQFAQKLLADSSPLDAEVADKYRLILTESVGRNCTLPAVEFRSLTQTATADPNMIREAVMLPPFKESGTAKMLLPSLDANIPFFTQQAQGLEVSAQEYHQAQLKVSVIHEGIHACSPFEFNPNKLPNPAIVDYTEPEAKKDHQGEYRLNYKVYRLKGALNPGVRLMIEVSKLYSNGQIETQSFREPGHLEELLSNYLTPEQVLRMYGSDSLEFKAAKRGQPYKRGIIALTNIFAAAEVSFEDSLKAKQQNDSKAIFELIQKGLEKIGRRAGIKRTTEANYAGYILYGFLTNLSTEQARIDKISPELFLDYLSQYFLNKKFNQTDSQEREQVAAVFNQAFIIRN